MMGVLATVVLAAIRISAMLISAPVLGHRCVPFYVKLLLAILTTILVVPILLQQSPPAAGPGSGFQTDFYAQIFSEALIGGLLGLGTLVIFSSAQMIGVAIGQMSGLQLDASVESAHSIGQLPLERFIGTIAVAMFVLVGGAEMALGAILDSFANLPVGSIVNRSSILDLLLKLLEQSFELTVLAIAPAVASIIISTITIGILMRTLPQLNLIQVGLSSNVAMMLLALVLTLAGCLWLLADEWKPAIETISNGFNDLSERKQILNGPDGRL